MNIFISHKHEDAEVALLLKRNLETLGGDKIDCFVSEHIPYGSNWFNKIQESLKNADALLLIFTTSDTNWDWPLYEVGLATNLTNLEDCRIITLYPPGSQPPEPIKHVQAVEASEQGIRYLIIQLICKCDILQSEEPINPKLENDSDLIDRFAKEISSRFQSVNPWEHHFTNYLWIIVKNSNIERNEVPRDARIDPCSTALEMFGLSRQPPGRDFWVWQDLIDAFSRGNNRANNNDLWIKELGERFYWASRGSTLKETRSTLLSLTNTEEIYRPLLHRAQLRPDKSMLFEVIFVRHYDIE